VLVLLFVTGLAVAGTLAVTGSVGFLEDRARFQSYDIERFGAQRTGIELAERYPVGIGPGQFEVVVPISTHSTYVRALAEQGVLGMIVIIALFLATFLFAARNAVLGRDSYGIGSAALLAAWVGLMINSFVVDTLHWRHLWFVAALIWVGAMRPRTEWAALR
jgi:ABC-type xylose transport system permease subunit